MSKWVGDCCLTYILYVRVGRHVYSRTVVSVRQPYKNSTKRVGLVQSEPHHLHITMARCLVVAIFVSTLALDVVSGCGLPPSMCGDKQLKLSGYHSDCDKTIDKDNTVQEPQNMATTKHLAIVICMLSLLRCIWLQNEIEFKCTFRYITSEYY
jgi:hypothetical protein